MMSKFANWYAIWIGKLTCFVFCVFLILVGLVAMIFGATTIAQAHFMIVGHTLVVSEVCAGILVVVTFLSQTCIQLLSLPALGLQGVQAASQAAEDHAHITTMFDEMKDVHSEIATMVAEIHLAHYPEKLTTPIDVITPRPVVPSINRPAPPMEENS